MNLIGRAVSQKSRRGWLSIFPLSLTRWAGGTFAFGVNDDATLFTPSREQAEEIVNRLGSIARNNLHIPIKLEHASAEHEGHGILFVHVPE